MNRQERQGCKELLEIGAVEPPRTPRAGFLEFLGEYIAFKFPILSWRHGGFVKCISFLFEICLRMQ
ncbi:MAG: hypothetical protein AB1500_05000 [Bacillota bacterium]